MNQADLAQSFAAAAGGRERLAGNFSARTFGNLAERAEREIAGGVATAIAGTVAIDRAAQRLGFTDAAAIEALKLEHVARVRSAWAAYQAAGARTANWMITGPARFPVARNRKRMDTEHRRCGEYLAIGREAAAWAEKRIKRTIRAELGPVGVADRELDEAKAKLAQRERRQAMMKAANSAIRKASRDKASLSPAADVAEAMAKAGFPEVTARVALELLTPNCFGGLGFERFQLSNNNAEIRRMQGRVAQLERRGAAIGAAAELEPPELEAGDGPRVVENVIEDRLQIFFPDRPSPDVRAKLKGRAFKWAPSQGAWQRQLTNNARDAARAVLAELAQ